MEAGMNDKLICQICKKKFASTSSMNRHVRDFHPEVEQPTQKKRIKCPMCPNEQVFSLHINLLKHLTNNHQVKINESVLYFRNLEEFTYWKAQENREVNYVCDVKKKFPNGEESILYNCNRSDSRGFVSLCKKRSMKTGGSIRMHGMCPSRINVKISKDGNVMVKFIETHVGHDTELRSKKLSKDEQNQHKITPEAHNKGNHIDGKIQIAECGLFKVQPCSENDKHFVSYNELCNNDCRLGYCNKCKICLHRYKCDCPDNSIKSVLWKHIHAVALFEERSEYVLGSPCAQESENLYISEPSTSQLHYQNDVTHSIQASSGTQDQETSLSFNEMREIGIAEIYNFSRTLNKQEFENLMAVFTKFKNDTIEKREQEKISKKPKIEKQT